jgi:hypothetical protein
MEAGDGAGGSLQGELSTVNQLVSSGRWAHDGGKRNNVDWFDDTARSTEGTFERPVRSFLSSTGNTQKEIVESLMRR